MYEGWIAAQIVIKEEHSFDDIKELIEEAKRAVDLDALIIWAASPSDRLSRVVDTCRDMSIETYLWFPIMADAPNVMVSSSDMMVPAMGFGKDMISSVQKEMGETFSFICPNSLSIERVFSAYEVILSSAPFDGVFLDRIRYPSPAGGFEYALSTCVCDRCLVSYKGEIDREGFDVGVFSDFLDSLSEVEEGGFCDFVSLWQDALSGFYRFRELSVYKVANRFSSFARSRGLKVGIDLFTPSIAPLVSQSYSSLMSISDWVKPMIYCHTMGPAGLPMELLSFVKGIKRYNHTLSEREILECISTITGLILPSTMKEITQNGVSEENVIVELSKISDIYEGKVDVYPGIEVVSLPPICKSTPDIIHAYLDKLVNSNGFVLSWNLFNTPLENLRIVGDVLGR